MNEETAKKTAPPESIIAHERVDALPVTVSTDAGVTIESTAAHAHAHAPSDIVPLRDKLIYGSAGIADTWSAPIIPRLQVPIFIVALGLTPSLVGVILMIFSLWSGISDPVFGWLSDNTRTRWGRRRPFILAGSVVLGLALPLVFCVDGNWSKPLSVAWLLATGMLVNSAHSCWNVPYQSLMLELTPDSGERTVLSAVRAYFQQFASLAHGLLWFLITLPVFAAAGGAPDTLLGARVVTAVMGVLAIAFGCLPAFFLCERYYKVASRQPKVSFAGNFRTAFRNRPFLMLGGFSLLYIVGANFAFGLFVYARYYHVAQGGEVFAAKLMGIDGVIATIAAIAGVPLAQWSAKHFGKRAALKVGAGISIFGALLSWVTFTPAAPWLSLVCNPLLAFAGAIIWVVIPSMTGDIADHDELVTGQRHEGAFASIFSWIVKMTMALGLMLPGPLIELVGFNVKLGANQTAPALLGMRILLVAIPVVFLLPTFFILARYPLNAVRMREIRAELEARRGKL